MTLNGDRYMDGGVRSSLNADLAAGARSVLYRASPSRHPMASTRTCGIGMKISLKSLTPSERLADRWKSLSQDWNSYVSAATAAILWRST